MKTQFFSIALLLSCIQTSAQAIYGIVADSLTKEPISYAHVVSEDKMNITYTNELGEFSFPIHNLPSSLLISHVSYDRKKISIYATKDTIMVYLKQSVNILPEIQVMALSPAEILKAAWQKNKLFNDVEHQGRAFYRQINKTDSSYTEVHEVFYTLIYTNQGISKWKLNQGRFAQQTSFQHRSKGKAEKIVAIRNFSSLSKIIKMYYTSSGNVFYRSLMFPVSNHVKELYNIELTDIYNRDGENYLSLHCTPKESVNNLPIFEGTIVLRERDYALASFEGTMNDPYGIDRTIGKEYKSKNHKWSIYITYNLDSVLSQSKLNFIKVINSFDYLNANFNVWHTLTTSSNLYLFEYSKADSNIDFMENTKKNLTEKDIDLISAKEYDPEFWRKNQIVKRTPIEEDVIKSFEQAKSFEGKLFKESN